MLDVLYIFSLNGVLISLISNVGFLGFIRFQFPSERSRSGELIILSFPNPADFKENNKIRKFEHFFRAKIIDGRKYLDLAYFVSRSV